METDPSLSWIKRNLGRKIKTRAGKIYLLKLDNRLPPHNFITAALCDPATGRPAVYAGIDWIAGNCTPCTAKDTVSIHVVPKPAPTATTKEHSGEGKGSAEALASEVR